MEEWILNQKATRCILHIGEIYAVPEQTLQTGTSSFGSGILQEMRVSISIRSDMNHNGTVSKGELQRIYIKKKKKVSFTSYLFLIVFFLL